MLSNVRQEQNLSNQTQVPWEPAVTKTDSAVTIFKDLALEKQVSCVFQAWVLPCRAFVATRRHSLEAAVLTLMSEFRPETSSDVCGFLFLSTGLDQVPFQADSPCLSCFPWCTTGFQAFSHNPGPQL